MSERLANNWLVFCCGKEIAHYTSYRAAARRCDYIRSLAPDHQPTISTSPSPDKEESNQ